MKIILSKHLILRDVSQVVYTHLTEKLQFFNPKWLENERMGRWNRGVTKILRLYRRLPGGGLRIPRGYLRQLILLCRRHDIAWQIEDRRRVLPDVEFPFNGTLRPFQQTAVNIMLAKDFGTLSSATGSGKTIMALYMIAQRRQPTLVVVHTKELALQWIQRIETFLGIPGKKIGQIGGGKQKIGQEITVALVQSLYKRASKVAPAVGHLVVDECHRTPSRTFTAAVGHFDSKYMLGLSATPWRRDRLSRLIFWHLGDLHHEVDKKHLIENGTVLKVEVIWRETAFRTHWDPVNDYSRMLSELAADDERNRLIAADIAEEARSRDGICLVLSDRKTHCRSLQALLTYKYRLPVEILTGDLSGRQRREVYARLEQGSAKVLVATGQLIGEGFDLAALSTLFLATPIRFSGRVLQYLGRVLRPAPGKSNARVFDYVDIHVEPLNAAAKARRRIYRRS